jgi:hypothetical protein
MTKRERSRCERALREGLPLPKSLAVTRRARVSRRLPEFLTSREVVGVLRVAPGTVRKWIRGGHVPGFSLPHGRLVRVLPADVLAFIQRARRA